MEHDSLIIAESDRSNRHCRCGRRGRAAEVHHVARPVLSSREREVLVEWIKSDTKADACAHLFVTVSTLNTHITRIRKKYADVGRPAGTKAALMARAVQDGLIDVGEL
ncbi:LuxR C-terminal-related transcriptional regulator [Nocardia aurantia]|uniref:LuxR C-terminal-related transcriptional regulator n=1 Tax=Nocardia aurantia TaxID=2585199 RepID=UPI0029E8193E|nr:LuxR family transcriptional regulator [Nocardia aurantia]